MADVNKEAKKSQAKTQFKKGNQAARGIEKEALPEARPVRILNRAMVTEIIATYAGASTAELRKVTMSPTATMLERIVCKIILTAEAKSDIYRLEFLLNRSIGKVKDEVEFTNPNPYEGWTVEQLMAERARLAEKNLATLRVITAGIPAPKQPDETPNGNTETEAPTIDNSGPTEPGTSGLPS